jgi:hypothetical protein
MSFRCGAEGRQPPQQRRTLPDTGSSGGINVEIIGRHRPRSSRHRGVLTLKNPVDVYDMRAASSASIGEIMQASNDATVAFKTNKIATRRVVKRLDGSGLADIEITMVYHGLSQRNDQIEQRNDQNEQRNDQNKRRNDQNEQAEEEYFTCVAVIPQKWKPRLFLALLNKSIHEYNAISLETVTVGETCYFGLNVVHCYFACEIISLHEFVLAQGAYVGIFGGAMSDSASWIVCSR